MHREGEKTFDISADLPEMGRHNIAVISSGVKSILDIGKTLEYLVTTTLKNFLSLNNPFQETQGVFVATLDPHSADFPAFYTRNSGFRAPYAVKSASEAAQIVHSNQQLGLEAGMLFAVPVPEEFALDDNVINGVVEEALDEAKATGVTGKLITPFLLGRIGQITAGKSLKTSILELQHPLFISKDYGGAKVFLFCFLHVF